MADIESLELRITSDSKAAKDGLDALIGTLDTLKTKTQGGCGLSSIATPLKNIAGAAGKLNGSEGAKLESLAKGLNALSTLGNLKLSSSVANQISAMGNAVKNLDGVDFTKMNALATAVQPLATLGKSNLGSVLNQIKKLPDVMNELNKVDMNAFATKIHQMTVSLKPLTNEMQKVANGFAAFPTKIQKFLNSSSKVPSGNASSAKSFANLATKIAATWYVFKRTANVIASWINKSNEYVEAHNLFTVSMGKYAASAQDYAEKVGEVMGIDPSTWMKSQGVFMTLATGFGVAGDRAAVMSQQLTQLGYDLSSFFNISVEEAMQKLKSGFSGELEPLRNLGYDLSKAALEAIALSLGIDKTYDSMTQAEKSQLRYYAIMTQVTTAQGDMARTLSAPANQMRILKAQVEQAARALGNIFIPILNAVLPYLIAAAKVIRILANAIASLVGFTMPEMDYSSLGNISAGAGEIGEEFDNAAGSAAKLKKTLLGIDELNVMPEASSGGGADVGGVGGGGFDFELPTYDFIGDAVSGRINEIVEKMKEWLGLTGEINSWSDLFDTRLGKILKAVGLIGAALAAWKIGVGVNSLIELIKGSGIVKFIGNVAFAIKAVAAGAATIGEAITYVFGGATGIISGVAVGILGLIGYIKNLISMIREGESVSNVLGAALGALGTAAGGFLIAIGAGATVATGGIVAAVVAGVAAIGMLIAVVTNHWDEIVAWFSDVCDKIGQFFADLWNGIVTVWNAVGTWFNTKVILPVIGFFRNLWTSVSGFFVNLWTDIVAIYFAIPGWFDTNVVQPIVNFFVGLWTSISNAASVCWNAIVSFFSPAVTWFSKLFGSILQTITDIFYNIGVIASGCWQIIVAVWGIVSQWFNSNVVQPVGQFFTNLWTSIRTTAINAWNGIKSVFATIGSWINQYVIQPVSTFFTNLWTKVRTLATTAWTTTQTVAINAWNGIKSVYATVTSWINTTIVQPVGTFFKNLWSGFLTGAKNAWSGVKSVFGQVASFFESTFKKAWSGVVKVFSVAGNIFVNIKNGIVTAFKSVVNGLIRGINNVVAVPFNAINNALYTLKNISILGLTPFSGIRTISIPSIPYLAQGGVVDAGQLFVANERGPELVANAGRKTAVMNNDQIVDSVSQGVYRAVLQAMGGSRGDQVVEAKVNDKVLFEVVVSRARQELMRTGHNPLLGGV